MADSPASQWSVEDERACVQRAAAGDVESVGRLYDAYIKRLYGFCLAKVGNETDAEDLAEDVFVKVIGALDGFEWRDLGSRTNNPFSAWVFRIARNHVTSFYRRAATRGIETEVPESLRDQSREPSEQVEINLTIEEVFAIVEQLPEAQRAVIQLRFGAGLSVRETAEALDKRETNVKVLQHKGVKRLRELLLTEELEQQRTN
jgi:RNA polymerase sigma-70 factor (ECF subfamily)